LNVAGGERRRKIQKKCGAGLGASETHFLSQGGRGNHFFSLFPLFSSQNPRPQLKSSSACDPFPTLLAIPNVCRDELFPMPLLKTIITSAPLRGGHDAMMT
jgi:hypothetical protein